MPTHKKKKKTLTKTQKDSLAQVRGHTAKHMAVMRKKMKEGHSLKRAHTIALRQVGK